MKRLPFPATRDLSPGQAGLRWFTVVAIVAIVGVAPGVETSLLVTGIASTFWQPVQLFVAAWTPWRPRSVGHLIALTLAIAAGAFVLLVLAMLLVAHVDFDHLSKFFPVLIAPAALLFETHLQLTMVFERKPFDRLGVWGGVLALATSAAVAVIAYELLVTWAAVPSEQRPAGFRDPGGPLAGTSIATWLITIAAWQVIVMVTLNGWPGSAFGGTVQRIVVNNIVVLGGATATVFAVEGAGIGAAVLSGAMGCLTAGGRLPYVLYDSSTDTRGRPAERIAQTAVWSVLIYAVLWALSTTSDFRVQPYGLWIAVTGLNLVSGGVTYASTFVGAVGQQRTAP